METIGSLTLLDPPEGLMAWIERALVSAAYSPSVTSWLDFLAERLATEFVREVRGG